MPRHLGVRRRCAGNGDRHSWVRPSFQVNRVGCGTRVEHADLERTVDWDGQQPTRDARVSGYRRWCRNVILPYDGGL